MEHIITRKKERNKQTNKQTKIQGAREDELEIKASPISYLFLCVKKSYYFQYSSKTCNSSELCYVDKILQID